MEQFTEGESTREEIKNKLRQNFDGKIVRKETTWHRRLFVTFEKLSK